MTEISERDQEEMRPIIEAIRARSQPTGRRIYVPREDVSVLPELTQTSENASSQPTATFPTRRKNASRSVSPATTMPSRRLSPAPGSISPSNTTFPSRRGRQDFQNLSRSVSPVAGFLTEMVLVERRSKAAEITQREGGEMLKQGKDTLGRKKQVQSLSRAQIKRRIRSVNLTVSMRQKRKADEPGGRTRKALKANDQAVAKSFFEMRAEDRKKRKVENMLKMKEKITELEILHKQHKSTNINKEMGSKKEFLLDVEKHRKILKISLRLVASLLHPPVHHKNYAKEVQRATQPLKNQGRKKINYLPLVKEALNKRSTERKDSFAICKKTNERRRYMNVSYKNCYDLEKDHLEGITYSMFMYAKDKLRNIIKIN